MIIAIDIKLGAKLCIEVIPKVGCQTLGKLQLYYILT